MIKKLLAGLGLIRLVWLIDHSGKIRLCRVTEITPLGPVASWFGWPSFEGIGEVVLCPSGVTMGVSWISYWLPYKEGQFRHDNVTGVINRLLPDQPQV